MDEKEMHPRAYRLVAEVEKLKEENAALRKRCRVHEDAR